MLIVDEEEPREGEVHALDRARFHGMLLIAGTAFVVFTAWIELALGGSRVTTNADDIGTALVALVATGLCFRAAARNCERRRFWLLLAIALACWSLGECSWGFYEVVLRTDVPSPSIADIGYLLAIPFAVAAMAVYPTGDVSRTTGRLRAVTDGLIIASSVLFVSWAYVLGPITRQHGVGIVETMVTLAYPIGDVVIASVALTALHRTSRGARAPLVFVAAGMLANAVSDSVFAYLAQIGHYASGQIVDAGWFAAYLLIALAAVAPAATRLRPARRRSSLGDLVVPYVGLSIVGVVAATRVLTHRYNDQVLLWLSLVCFVLVLVRQIIALLDNAGFMKDLAGQSTELSRALEEANEASRLKSAFIANMSHEIRTPMNGLMGLLTLMLDRDLGPVERDYAETMSRSAESLMAIVNDVLDFSKLEAHRVEAERELFSIHATVADAVRSIAGRAQTNHVEVSTEIANDAKNLVLGDRLRLGQVLANLLDNAVKFSAGGRVVLRVSDDGNGGSRFEIEDSGIGIAEEGRELLFESFTQADMSTTRRFGGTGLGLAICKQIVELMGGEIGVNSELGAGSTFWFVLPLEAAELPDAPAFVEAIDAHVGPPTPGVPAQGPPRATVLLAEDNEVNAKVAAAMLRFLGYEPVVVRDGIEALDALERDSFGAVLMDVQMPRLNGYDATRELRRRGFTLPVIAMTAMAQESDRLESLAAGMDDYVSKPINRQVLSDALHRQVRLPISSN